MDARTSTRAAVDRLAARAWPADDLERRARKTGAILRWAGVGFGSGDEFTPAELAAIEVVFGRVETGELLAFQRADGTFELRKDGHHNMPKRGRRKTGRRR